MSEVKASVTVEYRLYETESYRTAVTQPQTTAITGTSALLTGLDSALDFPRGEQVRLLWAKQAAGGQRAL